MKRTETFKGLSEMEAWSESNRQAKASRLEGDKFWEGAATQAILLEETQKKTGAAKRASFGVGKMSK